MGLVGLIGLIGLVGMLPFTHCCKKMKNLQSCWKRGLGGLFGYWVVGLLGLGCSNYLHLEFKHLQIKNDHLMAFQHGQRVAHPAILIRIRQRLHLRSQVDALDLLPGTHLVV